MKLVKLILRRKNFFSSLVFLILRTGSMIFVFLARCFFVFVFILLFVFKLIFLSLWAFFLFAIVNFAVSKSIKLAFSFVLFSLKFIFILFCAFLPQLISLFVSLVTSPFSLSLISTWSICFFSFPLLSPDSSFLFL